ncbi:MAG: hypothetical protein U1E13_05790 [Methylophilaceae bacterium]|nr:hypothetical protein [Methylophilaceae bacterium]
MPIKEIHDFLLYSLVINYLILLIWFGFFVKGHDFIYRLHSRWFNISMQTFDTIHYSGLAVYKISIILLNLVPLLALCLTY